jgi:hypothetical protein
MLGFIFGQGLYCLMLCLSFELPGDDINFGLQMNWYKIYNFKSPLFFRNKVFIHNR